MITDKLKQFIFNKLTDDLSHVELISHEDSLWFIDRENKYWYLEFQKSGRLYWRWGFFSNFFQLFCMERDEYEPLITEWVESVLNGGVTTTNAKAKSNKTWVESALNGGVTTTLDLVRGDWRRVESVLNGGVTTTVNYFLEQRKLVESVLNGGVTTTRPIGTHKLGSVESVLNGGVTTTTNHAFPLAFEVESVLNGGVITYFSSMPNTRLVESVLNGEVITIESGDGAYAHTVGSVLNNSSLSPSS
jgi:hypothetical protein